MKKLATIAIFAAAIQTSFAQDGWRRHTGNEEGVFSRTILHPDTDGKGGTRTEDKRDINSKILEKRTLDNRGVLLMKSLFELNASGNPVNGLVYDGRNNLLYRSEFVYDGADKLREERIFDPSGRPVRRLIYKPDPQTGEMRPAYAHTYVGGKEVSASSGDYSGLSSNSSHAYRGGSTGGGTGVANTATAYRPQQQSRTAVAKKKKREGRFRILRKRR